MPPVTRQLDLIIIYAVEDGGVKDGVDSVVFWQSTSDCRQNKEWEDRARDGVTKLPSTPTDMSHRPLQSVINLQRRPTSWGVHAGTSSRKCNQATFTNITTRAGTL